MNNVPLTLATGNRKLLVSFRQDDEGFCSLLPADLSVDRNIKDSNLFRFFLFPTLPIPSFLPRLCQVGAMLTVGLVFKALLTVRNSIEWPE